MTELIVTDDICFFPKERQYLRARNFRWKMIKKFENLIEYGELSNICST